ncbi:MAG: phosphonate C-P lyase system protein PhnH [Hyphomicrobiales bacterium]|nr:phosphonate C-P lyase system protein PhnH [Hyphomicrobiales bacterium]
MPTDIAPGFVDPVHESQTTFRAVLDALAEPGTIRPIAGVATAPAPLAPTAAAVVATLCDFETTVWRDEALATPAVDAWVAFHTGAPRVADPREAGFAIVAAGETAPGWETFRLGADIDPSTSTTVVLQVAGFGEGRRYRLSGPGIETTREIAILGAPADLAARGAENRALFPRGIDLILASPTAVVGLPRTTRIEEIA